MDANETSQVAKTGGKRGLVVALVLLVVVLAAGMMAYNALSDETGAAPGGSSASARTQDAPTLASFDATVQTQAGDAVTLTQIADGKPLVMNFWATWCPYCIQEMGDYQRIYDDYGARVSFAFIDVADGTRETVDDAAAWLRDNGYELPAYYDTELEATYRFGATNLPTTVVVAADGRILDVSAGVIDPDEMRATLDSLLGV